MKSQAPELLRARARAHGGDALLEEAADEIERMNAEARKPLTDDHLFTIWIERDCREAIQAGDLIAQFIAAARAVERAHGIGGD